MCVSCADIYFCQVLALWSKVYLLTSYTSVLWKKGDRHNFAILGTCFLVDTCF